jgi:hypothetical protein
VTIIQLNELIPVTTPLGPGYAILLEAGGHEYYWTVALTNGTVVTFPQERIRVARSYTHGRISDEAMAEIIK